MRVVNSRFQGAQELVVQLTEDNTSLVSLEGPKTNGNVVVGNAIGKDTVPVSGLTFRFGVGDMSAGTDEPRFRYVVRIVNDRMVLVSSPKP